VNAAAASPGFFREVIILYIFDVSCLADPGGLSWFLFFVYSGSPTPDPKTKQEEGETIFNIKHF
jgi:hypothetical protein